jgi:hypothetical protein
MANRNRGLEDVDDDDDAVDGGGWCSEARTPPMRHDPSLEDDEDDRRKTPMHKARHRHWHEVRGASSLRCRFLAVVIRTSEVFIVRSLSAAAVDSRASSMAVV